MTDTIDTRGRVHITYRPYRPQQANEWHRQCATTLTTTMGSVPCIDNVLRAGRQHQSRVAGRKEHLSGMKSQMLRYSPMNGQNGRK